MDLKQIGTVTRVQLIKKDRVFSENWIISKYNIFRFQ